ncbi:MAG: hypothetical protein AAFQ04_08405 [Pseudomonadota bacterium]
MAQGFSLKDQLFNATTVAELAGEISAGVPGFDAAGFQADVLSGFAERELMARLDWIADCLEPHLSADFLEMAYQLEASMPARLDPSRTDDDFGHFIHAVPGILAVRHGMEEHRERALNLLYEATQRFSMEFYIRPFLNRWPDETLARLKVWATDENYHVRRLVSEGTRPSLPWAKKLDIDPMVPLEFLDVLHADGARFVTRSVANHLNDISKFNSDAVLGRLDQWRGVGKQNEKELGWMTSHALRTLIKQGHSGALQRLGYRNDINVDAKLDIVSQPVTIGKTLEFKASLSAPEDLPVLVDYILHFHRPSGKPGRKVFKLKQSNVKAGQKLQLEKVHKLKGNATTFKLHPGPHRIDLQVNGVVVAGEDFELRAQL